MQGRLLTYPVQVVGHCVCSRFIELLFIVLIIILEKLLLALSVDQGGIAYIWKLFVVVQKEAHKQ